MTSVVDAMGRSTTFTYGLTSYPLLITKITDPFGRTSQLTYDTSQRLSSITDPVGITSSFTYSATETTFVSQLTTPYGTSNFNDTPNPNDTVETDYALAHHDRPAGLHGITCIFTRTRPSLRRAHPAARSPPAWAPTTATCSGATPTTGTSTPPHWASR